MEKNIVGFWGNLKKPIIGLAPMDGVTDAACRYMVNKYGKPAVTFTEFTNVEGLARGAGKMLTAFLYNPIERPIVGQLYGVELESFYKATVLLAFLGFDGVDINMGCPASKVAARGSGAGLIQTPELAKKILGVCKQAAKDWANGIGLAEAGVHPEMIAAEEKAMVPLRQMGLPSARREELPISVKTRIGFDKIVTENWIAALLEACPANISIHGRTLKQMYSGEANWEEIGKAAVMCRAAGVNVLGNGDIKTLDEARKKVREYGLDGVLVGRATMGNPWFFSGREPDTKERLQVCLEHCVYLETALPQIAFWNIRKHLAWYLKSFDGAKEMRMKMMQANNTREVEAALAAIRML